MTAGQLINYEKLTQDALRGVVRAVLTQVTETGLPGDHHFYIAFDTQAVGVVLSRRLKEKYPDEMMIVLQHRFWDLAVTDERFEVKLTFDGIPERLVVPFSALRGFHDPSVRFTLQFADPAQLDDPGEAGGPVRRRDAHGNDLSGARQGGRGGERRIRPRNKPRVEGREDEGAAGAPAADNAPALFVPRPSEPAPKSLPAPSTAAAGETSEDGGAPPGAGAKVFSLDQFRNKK